MAHTLPTLADFRLRYDGFDDVEDAKVQAALDDAALVVTTAWIERDYPKAIMLLAAHEMALKGWGEDLDVQLAGFSEVKIGPLQLKRDNAASASTKKGSLDSTSYGVEFGNLQRMNFGGPGVTGSGLRPCNPAAFDC